MIRHSHAASRQVMTHKLTHSPDHIQPEAGEGFVITPQVEELIERASAYLEAGYPINFSGPAGTGKTTLALHLAAKSGSPVMLIHGDDEFGSSDLVGNDMGYRKNRLVDQYVHSVLKEEETMRTLWIDNRLTTACRYGHALVYDEFTRSRPEANNVLLSVLGEEILNLPKLRYAGEGYLKVDPALPGHFHLEPGGIRRHPQEPGRPDGPPDHDPRGLFRPRDRGGDYRRPQWRFAVDAGRVVDLVRRYRDRCIGTASAESPSGDHDRPRRRPAGWDVRVRPIPIFQCTSATCSDWIAQRARPSGASFAAGYAYGLGGHLRAGRGGDAGIPLITSAPSVRKQGSPDMKSIRSPPRIAGHPHHVRTHQRCWTIRNSKYLALAMLELERARRNKEKQSASQRVANIDQRLADITAEQAELLAEAEAQLETSAPVAAAEPGARIETGQSAGRLQMSLIESAACRDRHQGGTKMEYAQCRPGRSSAHRRPRRRP